jgi:predicted dehydrogenase
MLYAQIFADNKSSIFIEKPISTSPNGIKNLIKTCEQNRTVLQVGYNLRFSVSLQKFKEIVGSRQLGVLQKIECETGQYLPDWRPESDYRVGVSARKELGGGVLLELSHEIDYLRWIFGEVIWVSGELTTESDLEIDVEDTARFKMGFHDVSDLNGLVANVTLDFVRRTPSRICRVYGSIANLEWNGLTGEVSIFEHNKNAWEKIYTDPNDLNKTYELEWLSFIDSVNTGNKPFVTGEDGLRVIEIIEAIRIASDTGGKVPVVYDLSIGK